MNGPVPTGFSTLPSGPKARPAVGENAAPVEIPARMPSNAGSGSFRM